MGKEEELQEEIDALCRPESRQVLATLIRLRRGRVTVTDGSFDETVEVLGGFYLIEARDLNEAIRVASKSPALHIGSVEVRPIDELIQQ